MTIRLRLLPLLVLASLCACSAEIRESDLLRPVHGGTVSADAVAKVAPAYRVSEQWIAADDGTKLHAVLLRQPGARGTVLYFGGNGYTIGRFGAWTASIFAPLGVDLMIVDHRGYGPSEGVPTVDTMMTDGLAAFDYLAGLPDSPPDRIIVHGQSLGSFVAGAVAAERPAAGVVLESSATTTEEWVAALSKGMPVKVRIDPKLQGRGNLGPVRHIEEPLLLLVGARDKTTPRPLSEALYRASPLPEGRKILAVIPGAGHDDVLLKPEAIAAYRRFLGQVLP
jgi:fermentation-respiration switch protein FrsA (DUF1100 family)